MTAHEPRALTLRNCVPSRCYHQTTYVDRLASPTLVWTRKILVCLERMTSSEMHSASILTVLSLSTAYAWHYNATSLATGKAIIVNQCDWDVYLNNVPSAGGGYTEAYRILAPGGRYEQRFTPLTNGNGWSIKLSKDDSFQDDDILQFEYTWHPTVTPDVIWFDVSQVNGNPWENDYWISAVGVGCNPKQQAYRYPTDDAYGMQACPSSADITVTLCRSEAQVGGHVLRGTPPSILSHTLAESTNTIVSTMPMATIASSRLLSQPLSAPRQGGEESSSQRTVDVFSAPTNGDTEPPTDNGTTLRSAASTVSSAVVTILEKIVVEEHTVIRPHYVHHIKHNRQNEHHQR